MNFRNIFLLFIFCIFSIVFSSSLFAFMFHQTDSDGYLNAIDLLSGREAGEDRLHRLIKPLSLAFPALLTLFFFIKTESALYIQQILAYLISILLFIKINKIIFNEDKFIEIKSSLLLIGCQCFAIYSLSLMVDGIAWAFELFAVWYYLSGKDIHNRTSRFRFYLLGIILGLGFFVKETIFISGLFIFIHLIISGNSIIYKIKSLFQTGFVFILIVLVGSLISMLLLQKSILNWWEFAREDRTLSELNLKPYLVQVYRSLDVFWILVVYGIFCFLRKLNMDKDSILFSFLLTALVAFVIFPFVWYYRTDRIIFMMSIFLLPFVNAAFFKIPSQSLVLIFIAAVFNLFMNYRIYKFEESGWIAILSLIFLVLLLLNVLFTFIKFSMKK
jgi:hypothetical protein